jgi:hypothetical protein
MKYNKTRSRVLLLVLAACFGTFLASSPFAIVSGGKENVSRILGPAGVVLREYETFTFGAIARLSDPVPQDIRTIQTLWALGQMTPRDVRCALAI